MQFCSANISNIENSFEFYSGKLFGDVFEIFYSNLYMNCFGYFHQKSRSDSIGYFFGIFWRFYFLAISSCISPVMHITLVCQFFRNFFGNFIGISLGYGFGGFFENSFDKGMGNSCAVLMKYVQHFLWEFLSLDLFTGKRVKTHKEINFQRIFIWF